jgi:NAD-dependent deacetylase
MPSLAPQIQCAADLVRRATHVVALSGAGISTPSGIPDFRSPDSGLWDHADPTVVASLPAFVRDPQPFYTWFRPLLSTVLRAAPNPAHQALAKLEAAGKLKAIVTQNIDDLHRKAGSHTVYELHGHVREVVCMQCQQIEPARLVLEQFLQDGRIPHHHCGGVLKPNVTLFGEVLPRDAYAASVLALQQADLVLVVGSSLDVTPASAVPAVALVRGALLVLINFAPSYLDAKAVVALHADVDEVFPRLV